MEPRKPLNNATPLKCSICKQPFTEYGNNAWPINNGRCCNDCNMAVVIPARIDQMRSPKKEGAE